MGMMESTPTIIASSLLRNVVTSLRLYAGKSLLNLTERYKLLEIIRYILITSFLFFLRLLRSFSPSVKSKTDNNYPLKPSKNDNYVPPCGGNGGGGSGDLGIARALSQLLSIVNDIPVNSRKYEVVRSLAERLIDDNQREHIEAFCEVNRTVLSAAFSRTLSELEAAVSVLRIDHGDVVVSFPGAVSYPLNRVLRLFRSVGEGAWSRVGFAREAVNRSGGSAEKLAGELLWLAQKLSSCGCGEAAVERWASASNLGWLALSAEPRLQDSLVRISAFLFKEAKVLGREENEESKKEQQRDTNMKMLVSWLPLLCRASNGVDVPVLTMNERSELENVLGETIDMLDKEDEQEQVLSLWLHHFTHCPSSDWPNLHTSYARWYSASRKQLLRQLNEQE